MDPIVKTKIAHWLILIGHTNTAVCMQKVIAMILNAFMIQYISPMKRQSRNFQKKIGGRQILNITKKKMKTLNNLKIISNRDIKKKKMTKKKGIQKKKKRSTLSLIKIFINQDNSYSNNIIMNKKKVMNNMKMNIKKKKTYQKKKKTQNKNKMKKITKNLTNYIMQILINQKKKNLNLFKSFKIS